MIVFKKIVVLPIIFVFLGFSGVAQSGSYTPDTSLSYDIFLQQCIDFKRERLGKEVWVVFFWASHNSRSLDEIPNLKVIHQDFKHKPVRFISISEDLVKSNWITGLRMHQMPWEHLMVNRDDLKFLKRAFPHNSFPVIFVVNPMGKIRRTSSITALQTTLQQETHLLPDRPYASSTGTNTADIQAEPETSEPSTTIPVTNTSPTPAPTDPIPQRTQPDPEPEPVFTEATTNQTVSWVTHTVKAGETLYRLYVKYKVSVDEIKRINNLKSNSIRPGQVLKIRKK